MRFSDFKAEATHARTQLDNLERAATREWVADSGLLLITLRVHVHSPSDYCWGLHKADAIDNVTTSLSVSKWRAEPDAEHKLVDGRTITGGYFDHDHDALGSLTAPQLREVAKAREIVDLWIAGKILELPATLG